jgi:glycosyltransferase involved in cell wall biosynthesis
MPDMTFPIVYAYPCRWDMTPARQRYLMEAMSRHTRVFFLNWPRHTARYGEALRPRAERLTDSLTLVHDAFGVRFARGTRRLGRVGAAVDAAWMHALLRRHGTERYIYWLAAPDPRMLWGMRRDRLVYDCIDPCFIESEQSDFDRRELAIARQSRLVFCSAQTLLDRCRAMNINSHLLPNACSPAEYDARTIASLPRPGPLAGRSGPVAGYLGTFDWRIDVAVLVEAARSLPGFTFALVGRINRDQEGRAAELRALPNVVMPGAVSIEQGRAYVSAFDVGLVPFLPGAMGDAINPVKMWMYLAAGKPVVSTWIAECLRYPQYVIAAPDRQTFPGAIMQALSRGPEWSADAERFARENSWEQRARQSVAVLAGLGLFATDKETVAT